jgi:hypothetical protein
MPGFSLDIELSMVFPEFPLWVALSFTVATQAKSLDEPMERVKRPLNFAGKMISRPSAPGST